MMSADSTLKEAIVSIQTTLSTLATKSDLQSLRTDINKMRDEIDQFCKTSDERIAKVESKMFDIEQNFDSLSNENVQLREQNLKLSERLLQAEGDLNELEQYGRRQNLKIYNLKESTNETVQETTRKACEVLTNTLKIETKPEHIVACHRIPASTNPTKDGKARVKPIIVD